MKIDRLRHTATLVTTFVLSMLQAVAATALVVDPTEPGRTLHREVAGQFWKFYRGTELGTGLRGIAGGLAADAYDWQKLKGIQTFDGVQSATNSTLQFLLAAKQTGGEPLLTVNMRGTGENGTYSTFTYACKNIAGCSGYPNLVTLASEWVRYCNRIVPCYVQGQVLPGSDQAILDKLIWTPKLVDGQAESPTPVTYWEIGNEPLVPLNGFTGSTTETSTTFCYLNRYYQIATAMRAADPAVRVGPCITSLNNRPGDYWWDNHPVRFIFDPRNNCPLDFVAYHPYDGLYLTWGDTGWMTEGLKNVRAVQIQHLEDIKLAVREEHQKAGYNLADAAAATDALEYICSEWNPANWGPYGSDTDPDRYNKHNNTVQSQFQALAVLETIFTYADLGVRMAHFWGWTAGVGGTGLDGGEFPSCMVFEKTKHYLGDRLLATWSDGNACRIYVTQDGMQGTLCVWGLNFSEQTDVNVNLAFANLPVGLQKATLHTLGHPSGVTSLLHKHTDGVQWQMEAVVDFDPAVYQLTLPRATIRLLSVGPLSCTEVWDSGQGNPVDFNQDCRVDLLDLAILVDEWLQCNAYNSADCGVQP